MYSDTYLNVFGISPGYSLTLESPLVQIIHEWPIFLI